MTLAAASRSSWYSRSESVMAARQQTESPVCTPIGSRFSIEQTITTLSSRSRITSSSNSRPAPIRLLIEDLADRDSSRPRATIVVELLGRAREAARGPRAWNAGRMRPAAGASRAIAARASSSRRTITDPRARAGRPMPLSAERLAVLGRVDRLRGGADQLDAELVEHARALELHREVERRLPPSVGSSASARSLREKRCRRPRGRAARAGRVGPAPGRS